MNDLHAVDRRRKRGAARTAAHESKQSRDPVLWIISIISIAALLLVGVAKYRQYQAQPQAQGSASGLSFFSGSTPSAADPGMEPDSFTTIEAVSEDGTIKSIGAAGSAGKKPAPRDYGSDCEALLREQGEIEARLRRPHGTGQAEAFNAQLRELASALARSGC